MTQPTSIFKTMCLHLAMVLVGLLALGPFLHAHYGASSVTGLHVAGVGSVVATAAPEPSVTSFSQDSEQESAALGVETSYARQMTLDVEEQPQAWLILTAVVLMAARVRRVAAFLFKPCALHTPQRSCQAGWPPLPHAPPLLHL